MPHGQMPYTYIQLKCIGWTAIVSIIDTGQNNNMLFISMDNEEIREIPVWRKYDLIIIVDKW